tara:strand:- start:1906 stop:2973 length:1068 start_codon:yes stop_codon:yes gene_type:complete
MDTLITGSAGLIGAEAVRFCVGKNMKVLGIDNDLRSYFFGNDSSTDWSRKQLESELGNLYQHKNIDIRNYEALEKQFQDYGDTIKLIIHTAAQPSHDWAAKEPLTDFTVNANGTLNLLELTRKYCNNAVFIFTSTNKVYGDTPNRLPLRELETRWEISADHPFFENGIDESMSIDSSLHSLFGTSKLASDVLVQEYGKYFGIKTVCFRGGCLTGPGHSGAELHGFLAYLVKCALTDTPYTIFGYSGKQVRDNIHSLDLVNAFWHFFENPRSGEVYNIGGGRDINCSMLEAISIVEKKTERKLKWSYSEKNRMGDHIWWVGDISKYRKHYPNWKLTHNIESIVEDVINGLSRRLNL